MTKVCYNSCFGGFGLSKEAVQRYFDIKGQQVWIEDDKEFKSLEIFTVWLVPPNERQESKEGESFYSMSLEERIAYNQKYSEQTWDYNRISRHDSILIQVVEELGEKANGRHANLCITEVQSKYRIDEYDGNESVETPDSYDWITP